MQQGVVAVSQGGRIILEEENYGGIYKLKEGNSIRGGVSGISLEGSLSRGGASNKTVTGRDLVKMLQERERLHSGEA